MSHQVKKSDSYLIFLTNNELNKAEKMWLLYMQRKHLQEQENSEFTETTRCILGRQ